MPIRQRADAVEWLHAQRHEELRVPRCYFSGRGERRTPTSSSEENSGDLRFPSFPGDDDAADEELFSVAGVGSAVSFHGSKPFNLDVWRSIKKYRKLYFLSSLNVLQVELGMCMFDVSFDAIFLFSFVLHCSTFQGSCLRTRLSSAHTALCVSMRGRSFHLNGKILVHSIL